MGLFDAVAQAVTQQAQGGSLLSVVGQLLSNDGEQGGLSGLVAKFNEAGLGQEVASWISRGENLPISAEQISQVLGSGAVSDIASKLGLGNGEAAQQLAQALPDIVDKLTPNGEAPAGGLGQAGDILGALAGLFGNR